VSDDGYALECPWEILAGDYDPAVGADDYALFCFVNGELIPLPKVPKELPNQHPNNAPTTSQRK